MQIIEKYLDNLRMLNAVTLDDFGDKKTVRKNNKIADENRQIAKDIENKYPELKVDFAELLNDEDWRIRSWVAHHMLEVMNYSKEYRRLALSEIKSVIERNEPVESLGNKMWLKQWYETHPEDIEL